MHFTPHRLPAFGWSEFFDNHFRPYIAQGYAAGRVSLEHKQLYRVYTEDGELLAGITGKLRHEAASRADLPSFAGVSMHVVSTKPSVVTTGLASRAPKPRKSSVRRDSSVRLMPVGR